MRIYAESETRKQKPELNHNEVLERRINDWNEANDSGRAPSKTTSTRTAGPVFGADDEFQCRVDIANSSRVATGLRPGPGPGNRVSRYISSRSEVTPWEPHGLRASLKKAMSQTIDKAKEKIKRREDV